MRLIFRKNNSNKSCIGITYFVLFFILEGVYHNFCSSCFSHKCIGPVMTGKTVRFFLEYAVYLENEAQNRVKSKIHTFGKQSLIIGKLSKPLYSWAFVILIAYMSSNSLSPLIPRVPRKSITVNHLNLRCSCSYTVQFPMKPLIAIHNKYPNRSMQLVYQCI